MSERKAPLTEAEVDAVVGRFIRSPEWARARAHGCELPLFERLSGRNFKISDSTWEHLRHRAADRLRDFADAVEAGDTSRIAIIRSWYDGVRSAEARHAKPPTPPEAR